MTTLTKTDEISIIKTDEVGRRQTPAARRERLLDEFDRSGLSSARFAAVTGLKYSMLATRLRLLHDQGVVWPVIWVIESTTNSAGMSGAKPTMIFTSPLSMSAWVVVSASHFTK